MEPTKPVGTAETQRPLAHGQLLSFTTLPALSAKNGIEIISLLDEAPPVVAESLSVKFPAEPGAAMETLAKIPGPTLTTTGTVTLSAALQPPESPGEAEIGPTTVVIKNSLSKISCRPFAF
jgi:hypothetical protein